MPAARAVGAEALVDRYSEAVRAGIATATEVHGASRLLAELRDRNVPTFINSATPTSALQDAVKARGWDRFVSAALGAPEGGGDKVDNLAEIARRAGCAAAEVAHVGDGANDASRRGATAARSSASAATAFATSPRSHRFCWRASGCRRRRRAASARRIQSPMRCPTAASCGRLRVGCCSMPPNPRASRATSCCTRGDHVVGPVGLQ